MEIQQEEPSSNSRRKNLVDRLLSIHHDVDSFLIPKVIVPFQIGKNDSTQSSSSLNKREEDVLPQYAKWPLLSNERCGLVGTLPSSKRHVSLDSESLYLFSIHPSQFEIVRLFSILPFICGDGRNDDGSITILYNYYYSFVVVWISVDGFKLLLQKH